MSKPLSAAIDWMTCAACRISGVVDAVIVMLGCGMCAACSNCFALATSRSGIGSGLKEYGWPGGTHWLPGWNSPLNTTWFRALRSIDNSSACRPGANRVAAELTHRLRCFRRHDHAGTVAQLREEIG